MVLERPTGSSLAKEDHLKWSETVGVGAGVGGLTLNCQNWAGADTHIEQEGTRLRPFSHRWGGGWGFSKGGQGAGLFLGNGW